jgi:branched-chain amino acid transport system permease protein
VVGITTLIIFVVGAAGLYFLAHLAPARAALGGVAMAIAFVLPHLWFTRETDGYLPLFTIVLCAVYALFALGLNIVVGFAGLLDLGYVAFFLVGAYVGAWLMSDFAVNVSKGWRTINIHFLDAASAKIPGIHLSFWIAIIVAGLVAALAGVIIGAPTLRLKSDYLALVTLGFGEILPEVFRNSDKLPGGLNLTNGTKGIGPVDRVGMGFLHFIPGIPKTIVSSDYRTKYYVILVFCGLFVWVSVKLRDGRLGRAWMAIREDELAASLMGVPLMTTKLWSYAVGAVAGGVGGAFYATIVGTVNVDTFTFSFSIIVLCAVILGGMGNVWGAILGAVVITWFNYTGLTYIGGKINKVAPDGSYFATFNFINLQFGLFGLVLVLMMLFRPDGFIPAARSKQVKKAEQQVLQSQEEILDEHPTLTSGVGDT